MPQMMPMNWIMIFIFSLMILYFLSSSTYFHPKNQTITFPLKKSPYNNLLTKFSW